jgi:hypothetical protein
MSLSNGCDCACTSRIFDTAQALLDYAVTAAATCEVELPARQEIVAGDIVHDCEKIVVGMNTVNTGLPLATTSQTPAQNAYAPFGCDPSWTLNLTLEIVRCGPELNGDGTGIVEAQKASAKTRAADAHIIFKAAKAYAAGSIGAVPVLVSFPARLDFISTVGIFQLAVGESICSHPQAVSAMTA